MKKTINFSTAYRKQRFARFSTMVKPVSSTCNLRCKYCYYIDKELQFRKNGPKIMEPAILEKYIKDYIESNDNEIITFCWHGGEPLLAGIDFYRKALEYQKKYANGKKICNTLQSNGILFNDEWAELFAKENFLIGISLDGPKYIHDSNRLDHGEHPTFDRVISAIEILKKHCVEFNTLSAVSAASANHGKEVYHFFKDIGSHYMQFLPVVEHTKTVNDYPRPVICAPDDPEGSIASWSITAKDYGHFLTDIFDEWVKWNDIGNYFVQIFDAVLARMCDIPAGVCSMNESCGDALIVEYDGSVYSCDHFVYPQYSLGNICDMSLREMYQSSRQFEFGVAKTSSLPDKCHKCAWTNICNGECPKHRFASDNNVNYLCSGLQYFYRHVTPILSVLKQEIIANEI